MGTVFWEGRPPLRVTLATDQSELARLTLTDQQRRQYHLLLPSDATRLLIHSQLDRPSQEERRWIGVQLFGIHATPSGMPLRAAALALLATLVGVLLIIGGRWLVRRGYGALAAITALALLLRLVMLGQVPPGLDQDELVSMVDAWYLLHTGHDHRGNWLPIGAFEAFGDWISPLLTYLELPLVAVLGHQNPLAGRLVSALAGALAVPAGYALVRVLALPRIAALGTALIIALSPWQITLTRIAIPPALVPLGWLLCILAAVLFVRYAGRRQAFWLALAAGIVLYAYPTMKMLVPLLVAWAVLLALWRHGWSVLRGWLWPALLLGVLWLPFAQVTLFNPASAGRLDRVVIQADTPASWLFAWAQSYGSYFSPAFYYISGDAGFGRFPDGQGVQLAAEAVPVLLGLAVLAWCALGRQTTEADHRPLLNKWDARLLMGAVLLAPLAASFTVRNPHIYRGSAVAPTYALLVGVGIALLWHLRTYLPSQRRRAWQYGLAGLLLALLLAQGGLSYWSYLYQFPPTVAERYQTRLLDTMRYAREHAPAYDAVWVELGTLHQPYIYLIGSYHKPLPDIHRQIELEPGCYNCVAAMGTYHFKAFTHPDWLPTLEAIPDRFGNLAFLVQEWEHEGQCILLVRQGEHLSSEQLAASSDASRPDRCGRAADDQE
jgi:4-amino-4-deoxy-L-arabinose transferase-like glycosyltransferase